MLRQRVLDVTHKATQKEALKRIIAGHQLLPRDAQGLEFILFSAQAQYRRPGGYEVKPRVVGPEKTTKAFFDPFAKENVEQDLFVTTVFDDHFLVLNKFAVVDEHLVLATVEFEEQEAPLTRGDLRAAWKSMQDLDAFAFFNCGYESGASQPHKHMQLISYPSMKKYCGLDMPPLLQFIDDRLKPHATTSVVQLTELPFLHYLHRIDLPASTSFDDAAAHLQALYSTILEQMNASVYARQPSADGTVEPLAYNLLLTQSFLFVVPRKTPAHDGIEVNSIGFIGSFYERNDEQLAFFQTHGAMEILKHVAFPPLHATSS
ncbi:hypothetical protein Poli38472_005807 [Pythium oligandrum]|uniref:ATP adenylyltransferase n=1 Tax=Pythium oligandrum TaxID=41045 RepID=A0A8K1FPG0_PYTOL|nr:hypothetical protein Poli38472_005807 [Pythium oligandrum]|eukprot:TMW68339.1 hypothetical protein Poli38472_005807 [Pythium oligandrum]